MTDKVFLGIDYGDRRIGLAKSDPTGLIASAYKTISFTSIKKAVEEIVADITSFGAVGVVVGYPVSPAGGKIGERCRMVDNFIERLEKKYTGPIYRIDERYSSKEAEEIIHMHRKQAGRKKGRIDKIAAAIILQRFLDEYDQLKKS
ncbi:putative Holliday junction resolvase [Candidatus Zixiibacteriota bacterium]|nr:putative Holliday junction resolvase [candidate division Zixibacteria bacterium]